MLKAALDYIRGAVVAELVTAEPGQALTYYTGQGLRFLEQTLTAPLTLRLVMRPGQWRRLEQLAEARGDRCHRLERRGLGETLSHGRRRLPFWLALTAMAAFTMYAPKRVWFVEVEGNVQVPDREILAAAEECGVAFWAKTGEIRSEQVKNRLLNLVPELQWAGVNFSGSVAVISVRERLEAEPVRQRDTLTDVVASRDGIVVSMSVLGGQAVCKVGQAVCAGEVLVSGCVEHEYRPQYTHADAEIYALTQRRIQAVLPSQWCEKVYTGGAYRRYSLVLGRKRINLSGNSGIPVGSCDKMTQRETLPLPGGYSLPAWLEVEVYLPYEIQEKTADEIWGNQVLQDCAQRLARQEMLAGEILGGEPVFTQADGCLCLDMTFACREMIARQRPMRLFEGEYTDE